MRTFDILSEFRALEALLNEVDAETGEFLNSEDDIKEYVDKNYCQEIKISMFSEKYLYYQKIYYLFTVKAYFKRSPINCIVAVFVCSFAQIKIVACPLGKVS